MKKVQARAQLLQAAREKGCKVRFTPKGRVEVISVLNSSTNQVVASGSIKIGADGGYIQSDLRSTLSSLKSLNSSRRVRTSSGRSNVSVRLVGDFWEDRRGNKWNADMNTQQEATRKAATLENTTDCTDCENCTDCVGCTDCTDCVRCDYCTDCNDCNNSNNLTECYYCSGCNDCQGCVECSNCTNCADCEYVSDLTNEQGITA